MILITTKKGKSGKTKVNLNISGGFSNAAVNFRPTLNGEQRRELLYEGLVNYASDQGMESPTAYADQQIDSYASVPALGYTDWRKELLRTATQQDYEASVSGGGQRTTYYFSLGYNKQEGLAKNSGLERYSARLNLTRKIGSIAEVGANIMFSQLNQELNEERTSAINPFFDVAVSMNPSMTVRDENGNNYRYFLCGIRWEAGVFGRNAHGSAYAPERGGEQRGFRDHEAVQEAHSEVLSVEWDHQCGDLPAEFLVCVCIYCGMDTLAHRNLRRGDDPAFCGPPEAV